MDLPTRFGKYELVRRLAKGGMAEIFLARSFGVEGFEKHLVIKRILPELAESQRFVSLFIKEAKISASLAHPNIVQIYELGRVGQDHYIAMEHIHGRDLTRINKALRSEEARLPLPLAVYVVASILRALAYAHARTDAGGHELRLIHRDVSPHNVMVSFLGEVKIFDFGIARLIGEAEPVEGMPGGGKYAYMSPEQAAGKSLDHRSDIFAAGVVLYELLVGHRLFQDPDPAEKLRKVRAAEVPDPRSDNPDIPDDLWAILQSMLALDPSDRPERAELAEEELWAFLFRHGLRADAHELSTFMRTRFTDDAAADPAARDLDGLAHDLRQLADGVSEASGVTGTRTGTGTGGVKLPRLLRGMSGERKPVVVLLAEVCGFTDLSEKRNADVIVRRHYQLLRRIRKVVDKHGGFLERYQDDRFVVFFGVPRAGEHDLARALACASALQESVQHGGPAGAAVDLSIGVHRGEITVGSRAGRSIRYLARGDTMKLAHRLCGEADLGEVLVSEKVAAMAGGGFRFTRGPPVRLKGGRQNQKSFQLHGVRDRAPVVRGLWIPRGDELGLIDDALAALRSGTGQTISINGGAGSGKTRLLKEIQDRARALDLPVVFARARPYRGYRPFDVLRAVVAHVLGIGREVELEQVQSAIQGLRQFSLSDRDIEVIGAMFGLPMNARQQVDVVAMKGAASRMLEGLASRGPVVVVTDDVQYVGTLEREIIGASVRAPREGPILFVFAGRTPLPAELKPAACTIQLERLATDILEGLIRELLSVSSVDEDLLELISKSAEGNPLYVDEITRMLRQEGRLLIDDGRASLQGGAAEIHLPPGLEALLAARIDALGPAAKGVLQIGATIGTSFSPQLVQEASGLDDIEPLLVDLARRGIIDRDAGSIQARCSFSSVLVWEMVHRSIQGVRLTEYHRMVADGMHRLHKEGLEEYRMQLAGHCAAGGRYLDAGLHAELAGDHLREQQLMGPAIESWEQGIEWLEEIRRPGHAARVCEATLRLKAGKGRRLTGDPAKAEIHLQVAQDLGSEVADLEIEARSTLALGRLYRDMGRPIQANASLESARSFAVDGVTSPSVEDLARWRREVAVDALADLGIMALDEGSSQVAEQHLEDARRLAGGEDALAARALVAMASRYIRTGAGTEALELLTEGRERAERAGDRILLGRVENNIGIVHHLAGRYEDALGCFRQALSIRQGLGYQMGSVVNLHNIGDAHFRMDDPSRAWAAFRQSRDLAEQMDWQPGVLMNDVFLAYLESPEDPAGAEVSLERAVEKADEMALHDTRISARWLLGRLRSENGDEDGARSVWVAAIALAEELDAPMMAGEIQTALDTLS